MGTEDKFDKKPRKGDLGRRRRGVIHTSGRDGLGEGCWSVTSWATAAASENEQPVADTNSHTQRLEEMKRPFLGCPLGNSDRSLRPAGREVSNSTNSDIQLSDLC